MFLSLTVLLQERLPVLRNLPHGPKDSERELCECVQLGIRTKASHMQWGRGSKGDGNSGSHSGSDGGDGGGMVMIVMIMVVMVVVVMMVVWWLS